MRWRGFTAAVVLALECCSTGCGLVYRPPADWRAIEPDLSNLEGTYANGPVDGEPFLLWRDVAPRARMAVWSEHGDRVSIEAPEGGPMRLCLIRDGRVVDEARSRYGRGARHVGLPAYSQHEGNPHGQLRWTRKVRLSVDADGRLCVYRFVHRRSLLGEDGGSGSESRYERVGPE